MGRRAIWLVPALVAAGLGCQAFVNSDAAGGIGAPCAKESECQASECIEGVCTLACTSASDCPEGTLCSAAKLCQLPFRAAWIYDGDPAVEEWSKAHETGRAEAAKLPFVTETKVFANVVTPADAAVVVDQAVAQGYQVVFATSPDYAGAIAGKAAQYPGTQFVTCGARAPTANNGAYFGRIYKAWYIAGKAAATKSPTNKRLGMVGSFVTPSVIRNINAFTRGAQAVDKDIVVEVRWVKAWQDVFGSKSLFATLADQLVATGCDVIAHQGFNGYTVTEVQAMGSLSIGNNVPDACDGSGNCMGAVYWNWGPLYRQILTDARAVAVPAGAAYNADIQVDPKASVFGFTSSFAEVAEAAAADLAVLAPEGGVGTPFAGDFCSTEVTPRCFSAMAPVTDDVLGAMCFFVVGVVEKDAMMMDVPAQVPPEGDCTPAM